MEDSAFCHPEKKAAEAEEEFRKSENPNVVSLRLLIHPLDFREFFLSRLGSRSTEALTHLHFSCQTVSSRANNIFELDNLLPHSKLFSIHRLIGYCWVYSTALLCRSRPGAD
jgi:hypothetical protein